MRELTGKGKIIIIVSHGLSSIKSLCNRCIWIDKGRIVENGAPSDVTKSYQQAVQSADEEELKKKFRGNLQFKNDINTINVEICTLVMYQDDRKRNGPIFDAMKKNRNHYERIQWK